MLLLFLLLIITILLLLILFYKGPHLISYLSTRLQIQGHIRTNPYSSVLSLIGENVEWTEERWVTGSHTVSHTNEGWMSPGGSLGAKRDSLCSTALFIPACGFKSKRDSLCSTTILIHPQTQSGKSQRGSLSNFRRESVSPNRESVSPGGDSLCSTTIIIPPQSAFGLQRGSVSTCRSDSVSTFRRESVSPNQRESVSPEVSFTVSPEVSFTVSPEACFTSAPAEDMCRYCVSLFVNCYTLCRDNKNAQSNWKLEFHLFDWVLLNWSYLKL